jgi:hypothetical protein
MHNYFNNETLKYLIDRVPLMPNMRDFRLEKTLDWNLDQQTRDAVERITTLHKHNHMMRTATLTEFLFKDLEVFFAILVGAKKVFGGLDFEVRFIKP